MVLELLCQLLFSQDIFFAVVDVESWPIDHNCIFCYNSIFADISNYCSESSVSKTLSESKSVNYVLETTTVLGLSFILRVKSIYGILKEEKLSFNWVK